MLSTVLLFGGPSDVGMERVIFNYRVYGPVAGKLMSLRWSDGGISAVGDTVQYRWM